MKNTRPTNHLLGYPPEARLLMLNADDFGMCHAINQAIIHTLQAGLVRSTSLMVPCPWARHAMRFLQDHPEIPFAIHLTAICDADDTTWGPLTCREKVPALVDQAGCFHTMQSFPTRLDGAGLAQLARRWARGRSGTAPHRTAREGPGFRRRCVRAAVAVCARRRPGAPTPP